MIMERNAMVTCKERVAIVTGGGRGVGRAHALALAAHGAKIIVNDLGSSRSGDGTDETPASEVVDEIRRMGGQAEADSSDVADWAQSRELIRHAIDTFGRLDILINNAGIVRDRMLFNMTESEWDSVVRVHLKGTFAPIHHAANYWRLEHKAGRAVDARIINTTSHSGLFANVGQINYGAAKAGIASLTQIAARELAAYGVTVNAISPRASTRMTEGLRDYTPEQMEKLDPAWIGALSAWLASPLARHVSGRVFEAWGNGYSVLESWQHGPTCEASRNPDELTTRINEIIAHARNNAGVERNTWHVP